MSNDYILRQDVLNLPQSIERNLCGETVERSIDVKAIEALEPADVVQVRHGRWTHKPNVYGVAYCSECDYELRINNASYCPNCGAKMDGERKE
jgi:exosome complex RNA-binding protein Csl4